MTASRAARRAPAAAAFVTALACASAPSSPTVAPACAGLTPPRLVAAGPVNLPATFVAARLASDVLEEIVVERDGAVRATRLVAASIPNLAPFAQVAAERARFLPAAIEGNPVAVRGVITIPIGSVRKSPNEPPFDTLRAFVPGGGSRESLWQLAGSVERLTLVAHVGDAVGQGAAIVAIGPGGAEKTLLAVAASPPPLEIRETVKTGNFLSGAGDYRLELRAGGKPLASTTVTIAAGFESAIVNACEPLVGPEKTGPGR
ncbi:MAG TPA: hypothetical protein VN032_12060 [Thermoanaerobaculia bacterium]|nr:hypothetical protein [Thermoanaerobaculia bacterium]